ncbi:MAG: hypothetical protein GEV00_21010 [Actinophytocola sp.]|nr:hypothetical protein [Actinophytocola sp.]
MNLAAVLATGLFAGGVSCAAVQGGLLAGLIARQRGHAPSTPGSVQEQQSVRARLKDDLTPVSGFLAGKLVSHTLLGALLGALGGVVQLSPAVRTYLQLAAGLLIIMFGLAQLGVPGLRNFTVEPPLSWLRIVRNRARAQSALAPAALGLVSVLIPCGVTLSVEALALTSGSPWQGAAIMAVFVVGTSPLFAVLGYAARKAGTAWRGRLAAVTGVVIVAMGLYTFNGGLELTGSPLAASRIIPAATGSSDSASASTVSTVDGKQVVVIEASSTYSPSNVQIRAGVPTTLIVRSDRAQGCVRSFLIPSRGVEKILPVQGDTPINLGAPKPGTITYSCGMGMYTGTITAT